LGKYWVVRGEREHSVLLIMFLAPGADSEVGGQVTLVGDMVNVTRALTGGAVCGPADALQAFPDLAQAAAPHPLSPLCRGRDVRVG
jgi:hypothetical protein